MIINKGVLLVKVYYYIVSLQLIGGAVDVKTIQVSGATCNKNKDNIDEIIINVHNYVADRW
jgi:hypothetical protein